MSDFVYRPEIMEFNPVEPLRKDPGILIPLVLVLIGKEVKSVVDFGCNIGQWLTVFLKSGVRDIMGIDGSNMVPHLLFDRSGFVAHDLSIPLDLKRKFDLALCIETAEHLRAEDAGILLDTITRHSDTVFWSAASPNQGGPNPLHFNEQWFPYWEELFSQRGYVADLRIRSMVPPESEFYINNNLAILRRTGGAG